ncbi:DUF3995 domain-containing protein [Pedobacter sp. PLR]|uniref:DUF3995 domain-containing protein n=1 Tax=Pedobacter sp. PLR TaxID=2994465 RepID=UPI002247D606|nr:DUF3995 domain-containing protein [Pedobacter sp. PLR]MCX2453490.1 DUF3995 domain-containing protein [Pedobacter sp. PLR]
MMMFFLVAINAMIFLFLAFLHIYWAFGGTWALENALPVCSNGEKPLQPGKTGTLMVALGLVVFAFITVANTGITGTFIPMVYIHIATYFIAGIFSLRAIGDFKYIGMMKSVKGTGFAKEDTRTYIPLCLLISLFSLSIPLMSCGK